jgi:5,10-methylenetetrahydromethanopterin reductase
MKAKATNWIATNADRLGVDSIWIGEDIELGQDVVVLSTASLIQTTKTRVGTGIIPIVVHSVQKIARISATLHETSGGRFVLGIGIGGIQDLQHLGIKLRKPVTELRKTISVLRSLWAGASVTIKSELMLLDEYNLGLREPIEIPIFLGVRGPQMLKLAGEAADGVILSGPFDYLKYAVNLVDKAAIDSGRKSKDVEKIAWLPTIPTFKGGKEELAKKVVSIVVADTPPSVLDLLDVDRERIEKLKNAVSEGGPDAGVPYIDLELLETFSITGSKEYMVDRFEELSRMGLTEVVIGPPFSGKWREAIGDLLQDISYRRQ